MAFYKYINCNDDGEERFIQSKVSHGKKRVLKKNNEKRRKQDADGSRTRTHDERPSTVRSVD